MAGWKVTIAALMALAAGTQTGVADDVVRNFTAGSNANSVGIVPPGEDSDTDGPQAIFAGEDGDVYLLDQLNNRVLKIDPRDPTREPQSLELPEDVQATDIVVTNDTIYAWDGQVRVLQPTGLHQWQGQPGGPGHSLLLGLHGIPAPDRDADRAWHEGRQHLHPQ